MITLKRIRKIHSAALRIDKKRDPNDYAPGERYIAILEIMLEYKVNEENSVFDNAAIALHTIAAEHPFVNGNKRTAYLTARMILEEEGYALVASKDEKVRFVVAVATPEKEISIEQIKAWLNKYAEKRLVLP